MQEGDASKVGYYLKPKATEINKLQSLRDLKYLLFSQSIQSAKEKEVVGSLQEVKELSREPLICKRCNDAIHKNQYSLDDFKRVSYDEVSKAMPEGSNAIHLVPLPEFPFHLSKKILEDDRFSVSLILTKGDQVFKDKVTLQKKLPIFFKDYMRYQLGISSNKTIAASATKGWNIKSVYASLKAQNSLLGNANVGKSTLINVLMKEYMGYKVKRDRAGCVVAPKLSKNELANPSKFLKTQYAGVSHIPNMTRRAQEYKIGDKTVSDLPGFTSDLAEAHLEDIVKKDWLDRIRRTELFKGKKLKKKTYYSMIGSENGSCYSVGGIFFLKPPVGTVNQIVKYIPGEEYEFRNIEKGLEVFKSCTELATDISHPLDKYCGIKHDVCHLDRYARHVIPPFQGSIEIVLKDIGYILLRTTGRYKFTSLHEIWVPKSVKVCIREPLELVVEQGFKTHIESGGKLSACPKKRPIISSTYVMDPCESDILNKMREMYLQRTKNDLSSRRFANDDPLKIVQELRDDPPNLYWHYHW